VARTGQRLLLKGPDLLSKKKRNAGCAEEKGQMRKRDSSTDGEKKRNRLFPWT